MKNEIQELIPFNKTCDEFVKGKYILVDAKIDAILKIIANDEKLRNIVNSCLENFDFFVKSKLYILKNGIIMPTDENEVVAFVYNLLYRFKSGDIDFYEFISSLYGENGEISSENFEKFARSIIEPFKQAISSIFTKRHVLVDSTDYQNNYYNKIKSTVQLILKNIDEYRLKDNEKEEFIMLLNSLYIASENNDRKLVYSLMIGLDYFTKANKKSRVAFLMLEECFE
ncbi:MAG: hypothetical protein ACI4L6_03365 [Candidatus Onthoplasma sp.]